MNVTQRDQEEVEATSERNTTTLMLKLKKNILHLWRVNFTFVDNEFELVIYVGGSK